jgi:hypothetical protein
MKQDKIYKYSEYLKENIQDTPETYVENALRKLENRLKNMFETDKVENGEVKRYGTLVDKDRKEKGEMSFKDLGLELQSLELSKYSKVYDNVKMKFTDEKFLYDMTFTIDLKDAVPKDDTKDFSDKEIENCQIKFKKYDQDNFKILGPPGGLTKTAKISEINEEYLIYLKIELDDDNGGEEEEFEIETEE